MTGYKKYAKEYLNYGLNPVPVGDDKIPIRKKHNTSITLEEIDNYEWFNIGVSTGIVSGGLEVLDFDLKNAEDPNKVMQMFKSKVPKEILKKLVVQTTPSGGYHFIYRCEDVSSNKKIAKNDEGFAVIETRGEGGYIKCSPSDGYKLVQHDFSIIPIITPIERVQLMASAKMLDKKLLSKVSKQFDDYVSKFPEFNSSSKIGLEILYKHGWTKYSEDNVWVNLTRPNKNSGVSAGYHKDGKFLYVFSTSQDTFETERPYNNHAILAELDFNGDYKRAYAWLYDNGYGNDIEQEGDEDALPEDLNEINFLSDEHEENSYLEQVRKDAIPQGYPWGWGDLDRHLLAKPNSLNIGLGYDGVGKSLGMLSLAVGTQTLHDWKWGIIAPENKTGMTRRRLIELKYGEALKSYKNRQGLFNERVNESREYFKIMSNRHHYSIKDVLKMGEKLYKDYGINALIIDPYNFFKVEGGNGYSYNNEILSEMRVFAEKYCAIYVLAHPNSNEPRTKIDSDGYLRPPSKYSIQGGADFPYRVDDFFIWHRIVNHEEPVVRRTALISVEKIKEVETGGRVTTSDERIELIYETRNGFTGFWDSNGENPMYNSLMSKLGIRGRSKMKRMSAEEAFE